MADLLQNQSKNVCASLDIQNLHHIRAQLRRAAVLEKTHCGPLVVKWPLEVNNTHTEALKLHDVVKSPLKVKNSPSENKYAYVQSPTEALQLHDVVKSPLKVKNSPSENKYAYVQSPTEALQLHDVLKHPWEVNITPTEPLPIHDVVKHPSEVNNTPTEALQLYDATRTATTQPKRCHTPPPSWQLTCMRKLSPSLPSLCLANQNTGVSRPTSPGHMDPVLVETIQRRVRRVQKARLYLLRQPGPNSFCVGGDSPDHKFCVVIGPQTCSCNRGPHCLHLLFIMLRVFQVAENDPRLFAKELKNFEVESLFRCYKEQQNTRIQRKQKTDNESLIISSQESSQNVFDFQLSKDKRISEDEKCPICLLEMVDGESLVECTRGCHNKLHYHCMAIWAGECAQQGDAVLCPLCRCPWMEKSVPNLHEKTISSSCGNNVRKAKVSKNVTTRVSSTNLKITDSLGSVPLQNVTLAADWIKVLGSDLVSSLYSQDWKQREQSLKLLQDEVRRVVRLNNEDWQQKVIRCSARILAVLVADPVFKVYSACVRCLCTIISLIHCASPNQLKEFVELICPLIKTMLKKCADRNQRASQFSIEALTEISKREIGNPLNSKIPGTKGVKGLEVILSCILEPFSIGSVTWQWLAGRLVMIKMLFHLFHEEFHPGHNSGNKGSDNCKANKLNRLLSLTEFSVKALLSTHRTVVKIAKDVFSLTSSVLTKEHGVQNKIFKMLAPLDINLQIALQKRVTDSFTHQSMISNDAIPINQINTSYITQTNIKSKTITGHLDPEIECKQRNTTKLKDIELGRHLKGNKVSKQFTDSCSLSASSPANKFISSSTKLPNVFLKRKEEELSSSNIHNTQRCTESSDKELGLMVAKSFQESTHKHITNSNNCEPTNLPIDSLHCSTNTALYDGNLPKTDKDVDYDFILSARSAGDGSEEQCHFETQASAFDFYSSPIKEVYSHINISTYKEGINWDRGPTLGAGAYSTCFQARDILSGGIMAVKQVSFLRNSLQEQERVESEIWKEIIMLSKLHHPNILHIIGATKQNGHFNIFVEWMAGGSIAALLDSYGPFSEEVIINYTKQIFQGLNYLHKNHILHRDLKGANLLIDSTGQNLCIGDFGAAIHLENQAVVSEEFQGQILGTIAFMAPEVLRGENYGRSCDVWSVGCCIIEMVTTKPPWKENQMSNHLALMYKIASSKEPPFIPNTLGTLLRDVTHKCLQIKAELRPTAKELLDHECFRNITDPNKNSKT